MLCKKWLELFLLLPGKHEVSQIKAAAFEAGYTKSELRDAKKQCRIIVTNNWSAVSKAATEWYWSLPKEDTENAGIND